MRTKKVLVIIALTLIVSFAVFAGDKASDFTLTDLNGNEVSLSDYEGKVVLLNFWATWCSPCRAEIPDIDKLYKNYESKGFRVLGITSEDKNAIRKFMRYIEMSYPILFDNKNIGRQYQYFLPKDERGYIPFTHIINREGYVVESFVGSRSYEDFKDMILPLLED